MRVGEGKEEGQGTQYLFSQKISLKRENCSAQFKEQRQIGGEIVEERERQ